MLSRPNARRREGANQFGACRRWRLRGLAAAFLPGWKKAESYDQPQDKGRDQRQEKAPGVAGVRLDWCAARS
jgi:hypothetical protein